MRSWGWIGFVVAASLILNVGCAFVDDSRAPEQRPKAHPNAIRSGGREPSTSSTVTSTLGGLTVPATVAMPEAPERTSSNTLPTPDVDSNPSKTTVLDPCARVRAFADAGTVLFYAAEFGTVLDRTLIESVLVALADLGPVSDNESAAILADISDTSVPVIRDLMQRDEGVPVTRLRATIDAIAPEITALMRHLQKICPAAIGTNQIDNAERVHLGQPLP